MSVCVRIPKEITEYKEKIIFGLSLRQLLCFSGAILLAIGSFFLFQRLLNLNGEVTQYLIMIEVTPILAVGFFKKNGFPFEKYVALFLRHQFGTKQLVYKTQLTLESNSQLQISKKGQDVSVSVADKRLREAQIYQTKWCQRARKRRLVCQKIKAARRDFRQAKRQLFKASQATRPAKISPRVLDVPATV